MIYVQMIDNENFVYLATAIAAEQKLQTTKLAIFFTLSRRSRQGRSITVTAKRNSPDLEVR